MKLSVIIVTYNSAKEISRCLDSLSSESSELDLEVIVVDNDSRDDTPELLKLRSEITLIQSEKNRGFAWACNRGLGVASGDYLLLLNPDTEVSPRSLLLCVKRLQASAGVGMLGPRLVKLDGTLDHACKRGFPSPLSALFYFSKVSKLRPSHPRYAAYEAGHIREYQTADIDAINGAFMLVTREAYESVGDLDETFWMYGEDLDWCYRFHEAGWKVLYYPEVTVLHLKGASSGSLRGWKANYAFHRSMWIFYALHYKKHHHALISAAVFAGVHGKLALSALRSAALGRLTQTKGASA